MCHLMTLGIQVRLLISWHEYVQQCYEVHSYVITIFVNWRPNLESLKINFTHSLGCNIMNVGNIRNEISTYLCMRCIYIS